MEEWRLLVPGDECIIDIIGVYIQTSFALLLPPEAPDIRVNAIGDDGVLDFEMRYCKGPAQSLFGNHVFNLHSVLSGQPSRSEEHTSELQSLMRISYAVFCLKKKKKATRLHKRILYKSYYHKSYSNMNSHMRTLLHNIK